MKLPQIKKTLLTLGLITGGIVGAFAFFNTGSMQSNTQSGATTLVSPANAASSGLEKMGTHPLGDQLLGKKDAPILMIEYASFTCPHCAYFHSKVFPHIKKDFIDTGKVRFIYRDYPLNDPAFAISMITRCIARDVGNDKFYPLIKVLFDTQDKWLESKDLEEDIAKITKLAGFGKSKFDGCFANKTVEKGIREVQAFAGKKLGIRGTPTLFINGELYEGKGSFEAISTYLDAKLK